MLKRLQLVGFKSFADRTDFDFPAGLTAIVGPNGSGKSNIVDAVRWVLGEQSARSLRGGEMADVIFNGSASRRGLGLAEVTMTFDNGRRSLATDGEEIQVTRRVYRSGEGEYLINQQPCRLKDIKDLFLGSGAGTDAYSVIEQGKVDVMLQASTRERRAIFEEAAGISRFKAQKVDSLRKLERADTNLQRLKDIIDEVDKQLRSVRLQAAKAQRYQEHSARLKELRVGLGLQEYDGLARQLQTVAAGLEQLRAGLREEMAQAEGWERQLAELEQALAGFDDEVRRQEAALATAREGITADLGTLRHEAAATAELEADRDRTREQLAGLEGHVAVLAASSAEATRELRQVEASAAEQRAAALALERDLELAVERLAVLQEQIDSDKDEHLESMRQAAHLRNDVVSYKAEFDNLTRSRDRLRHKSDLVADSLASVERHLEELSAADRALQERLAAARQNLAARRVERERLHQLREDTTRRAAELRAERSGVASRIEVLEGLERSHEGMDTGVREVFALLEQPDPGPWRAVRGIVADFLTVRREYAPLIDLALGERSHYFLVRDPAQFRAALEARGQPFSGRVSFFPLTPAEAESPRPNRLIEQSNLVRVRMPTSPEGVPSHTGVVALAEHVVTCDDPDLADLPRRLLARTLLVWDLETARAIAAHTTGFRFVTLRGELLEADGTLTVGTHHAETGILSRKSELRELRGVIAALDARLADLDRDLADLARAVAEADLGLERGQQDVDVLAEEASDLRSRLVQQRQKRDGLHEEAELSRSEMDGLDQEMRSLESAWRQAQQQSAAAEARVQELQERITTAEADHRRLEQQRQLRQEESLSARVGLAQVMERQASLRARVDQVDADLRRRLQERSEAASRLADQVARLGESAARQLAAGSSLAVGCRNKETSERALAEVTAERERRRTDRQRLGEQAQALRETWQARQEQLHTRELEANDLRHGLDSLVGRLQEDYQIDLAALYRDQASGGREPAGEGSQPEGSPPPPAVIDPAAVAEEIAELRRKLTRLGSVNLDALQELSELELRAGSLQAQYDDLASAKRVLEDIIARINVDSRRLFTETLTSIRTHFQELFRKLFGGGQADIVLEDEGDVLESGIEVIARPPGKELRSISLLSGGEKTLTAVALLLAIFRSKPSPFCILDEVDAALDEANIGRLMAVLREFLDRSQFILITHSKRTMAEADVLYGVTMQESGVSKRIAIRFEDWPDEERPPEGEQVA